MSTGNGARLGWLVDPIRRELTIYRSDGSVERRAGLGVADGETVLRGSSSTSPRHWEPGF